MTAPVLLHSPEGPTSIFVRLGSLKQLAISSASPSANRSRLTNSEAPQVGKNQGTLQNAELVLHSHSLLFSD